MPAVEERNYLWILFIFIAVIIKSLLPKVLIMEFGIGLGVSH